MPRMSPRRAEEPVAQVRCASGLDESLDTSYSGQTTYSTEVANIGRAGRWDGLANGYSPGGFGRSRVSVARDRGRALPV